VPLKKKTSMGAFSAVLQSVRDVAAGGYFRLISHLGLSYRSIFQTFIQFKVFRAAFAARFL